MTPSNIENYINQYLEDLKFNVISISGPWGCGKTHLIRNCFQRRPHIYLSLFGTKSSQDIKTSLILSSIGLDQRTNNYLTKLKQIFSSLLPQNKFSDLFREFLNINAISFLEPTIREKVIILDDLERVDRNLSFCDLFGLVNYFVTEYQCKFILILNEHKITSHSTTESLPTSTQNNDWLIHKEKIIDDELHFQATINYSFKIAKNICNTELPENQIQALYEICSKLNLINIRIIVKLIRHISRIIPKEHNNINHLRHYFPGIVLAILDHYGALPRNLTYDKLRNSLTEPNADCLINFLLDLSIFSFGKLEDSVHDFINGHSDNISEIHRLIKERENASDAINYKENINKLIDKIRWSKNSSPKQILREADNLHNNVKYLDPAELSNFINFLKLIPTSDKIQDKLLRAWENYIIENPNSPYLDSPLYQIPNDEIQNILNRHSKSKLFSPVKSLEKISQTHAWRKIDIETLNNLSSSWFYNFFKESTDEEFKHLIYAMRLISLDNQFIQAYKNFDLARKDYISEHDQNDHTRMLLMHYFPNKT